VKSSDDGGLTPAWKRNKGWRKNTPRRAGLAYVRQVKGETDEKVSELKKFREIFGC
jgi:hypothetical protein